MAVGFNCNGEFDGVDEVPMFVDSSSSSPLEPQRSNIYDLMLQGNRAFQENRLEDAISIYSKAHRLHPIDPIILINRSSAFCHYSQHLRNRPAAMSV